MNNPFLLSDSNKRYHTQNYYLRSRFNNKVIKIPLNGGFSCPNKDGTKGFGGCSYCSSMGSGEFAGNIKDDINAQFKEVRSNMEKKWKGLYIPYFQANTNTYAPLEKLKYLYETALLQPDVVGLSIATRPDCIDLKIADYLKELSERTYLTVELGLQSVHDETGVRINRCHTYKEFLDCFKMLTQRGINVCVHIINGLPGENHSMMLDNVKTLPLTQIHSIKIHMLHIILGTKIADEYQHGDFKLLTLEEYVDIICDQIELLPSELIVQRITGDPDKKTLIGPLLSLNKFAVMNEIDKEFVRRNSWQGKFFNTLEHQ